MDKGLFFIIKKNIKILIFFILKPFFYMKWNKDLKSLPLNKYIYDIYFMIHTSYWIKFRRFPNLVNPSDYNEKINWLKLFDQSEEVIECCDKYNLRHYVEKVLGDSYCADVYAVAPTFDEIEFKSLPSSYVIRTNHDSGTVIVVKDSNDFDFSEAKRKVDKSLACTYGWDLGEWAYSHVKPLVYIEELLPFDEKSPPPDYKFHCVNGKVCWLQYIFDRGDETKEIIIDKNGDVMDVNLDTSMEKSYFFEVPEAWGNMINICEKLSAKFKYVRVDLYLIGKRIVVGEMTFFPMAGLYKGLGQKKLSKYLDFDRTSFKDFYH